MSVGQALTKNWRRSTINNARSFWHRQKKSKDISTLAAWTTIHFVKVPRTPKARQITNLFLRINLASQHTFKDFVVDSSVQLRQAGQSPRQDWTPRCVVVICWFSGTWRLRLTEGNMSRGDVIPKIEPMHLTLRSNERSIFEVLQTVIKASFAWQAQILGQPVSVLPQITATNLSRWKQSIFHSYESQVQADAI